MSPRALAAIYIGTFLLAYAALAVVAYREHERYGRCIASFRPEECQ